MVLETKTEKFPWSTSFRHYHSYYQNKASIPVHLTNVSNRQEIIANLHLAIKDRSSKQAKHPELRENYLNNLVEALVLKNNPSLSEVHVTHKLEHKKAKQIKALARREKKRRMFMKINNTLSPTQENMQVLL